MFRSVFCILTLSYFLIQFLKVIQHLQLLQNIGYVLRVVQYIPVVCLTPNNLYLPLPDPYILPLPSSPLVTTVLLSTSMSLTYFLILHVSDTIQYLPMSVFFHLE